MPIQRLAFVVVPVVVLLVSGCAARSKTPATTASILDAREGLASYYGPGFDGKITASGTRFDMRMLGLPSSIAQCFVAWPSATSTSM